MSGQQKNKNKLVKKYIRKNCFKLLVYIITNNHPKSKKITSYFEPEQSRHPKAKNIFLLSDKLVFKDLMGKKEHH